MLIVEMTFDLIGYFDLRSKLNHTALMQEAKTIYR